MDVKIFLRKHICSDADEVLMICLLGKKIVYERVGVEFWEGSDKERDTNICVESIVPFVGTDDDLMKGPFRKENV